MVEKARITAVHVGASGYFAAVCRRLRIASIVNNLLQWDEAQWKRSPGTLVTALIINILMGRQPLYRVWQFYQYLDLPILFDEPIELEDLNDDAFGRTLDRMHESGQLHTIFDSVALRAVRELPLGIRSIHADTTSFSVAGAYDFEESAGNQVLRITHGYSKDQRPDLKQFIYGLIVSSEGLPLYANVRDGNLSDKVWHQEVLHEMQQSFLDPRQVIYIADSALITPDNLTQMAQQRIRFISRLPEVYGLAKTLKERAWAEDRWESIGSIALSGKGAYYKSCSYTETLEDRSYRFVVVYSDAKDKRKTKTLTRRLEQERDHLEKAGAVLAKQRFNCESDAEQALSAFCNEHRKTLHTVHGRVVGDEVVKRPPGRPAKGATPPTVSEYRIEITIDPPSAEVWERELGKDGTFVLITNLDEAAYSDAEILSEYKGQTAVETRFRNLKSDPCIVDNIYVKSPRRAEALAYIFLLALLVASFIEVCMRQELKRRERPFLAPPDRWVDRPTMSSIFDILETMLVIHIHENGRIRRLLPDNVNPWIYEILELTGLDYSVYTRIPQTK